MVDVGDRWVRTSSRIDLGKLSSALHYCWDLSTLQKSEFVLLPSVAKLANGKNDGLQAAKALRDELIACAEQLTQRKRYPIEEIASVLEMDNISFRDRYMENIQRSLGVPFSRDRLDLARYYAIRMLMEGVRNEIIAKFLMVDSRTVGNYIAQAKERIRFTLESRWNIQSL
jgi:DNA-binding CsgD family transcriptional regulator